MMKPTMHNFAHLTNMRPAMRPEDLPPGTPFAHLLGGNSNSPSRVEGWEHRTRNGGYLGTAGAPGKEHAR